MIGREAKNIKNVIKKSYYEYVIFIDVDIVLHPRLLRIILEMLAIADKRVRLSSTFRKKPSQITANSP